MDDERASSSTASATDAAVFRALAPLLRELCRDPLPDLAPGTVLSEIPGIDSLRLVQAIAVMEETFDVEIGIADLDPIKTVADILRAITDAAGFSQSQTDQ